jgi:SLOG in TRPM, prokaryote
MEPELLSLRPGDDLRSALSAAGILLDRPVLVCVGGAGGMTPDVETEVADLLRRHLVPALDEWGVVVVDGGTDSGLMRSLGLARAEAGAAFQLVGVAAQGTVVRAGDVSGAPHVAELEPHHTHAVLVPGDSWGDESPWVSAVAAAIAGDADSVTLLVNGGAITLDDADLSLAAGRPLVVLAGSGRVADDIAGRELGGDRTARIADDQRTQTVPLTDGPAVVRALSALLNG